MTTLYETAPPAVCPDGTLNADDITWALEPLARIEFIDVSLFTEAEIRPYAIELQWDLESVRRVLSEALAALARAAVQADRYQARLGDLQAALRTARQSISDLRAQLHAREDGGA